MHKQTIAGLDKTCLNCTGGLFWTRRNLHGVFSRESTPLSTKIEHARSQLIPTLRLVDAPTKPRRIVKKHALGSLTQLSYCPRVCAPRRHWQRVCRPFGKHGPHVCSISFPLASQALGSAPVLVCLQPYCQCSHHAPCASF